MLGDAAKIQEEDAAYLNRHREKGEPKVEPLYDGRDVYRTLLAPAGGPVRQAGRRRPGAGGDVRGRRPPARLGDDPPAHRTDRRSLTFTGDLGRPGLPILRDPAPVPPADLLISESTYGGHTHEPVEETAERLGDVVRQTADRGGKLIIPAFSVGRTQTIVYFLHQLMNAGRLPDLPIFVDSPMAVRATEVFRAHPECFDDETLRLLDEHPDLFGERACALCRQGPREHRPERPPGAVRHHLGQRHVRGGPGPAPSQAQHRGPAQHDPDRRLPGPRDTLGRRLVERRPEVRILGRTLSLKAEVVVLNGLSSHADHGGLLRSLEPLAGTARQVRLVHGEPERATALAEGLRAAGFADVVIPERGESVRVER